MPHNQMNNAVQQPPTGYPPTYQNPTYYNPPPSPNYINIVPQRYPATYVVDTKSTNETMCHICHKSASCISRKKCGCALAAWSAGLFIFTKSK